MSEFDTPHLELLLDALNVSGRAPATIDKARAELHYLKVQHAKLMLDYYAEYCGVPTGAEKWNDDEVLAWARREYDRVSSL